MQLYGELYFVFPSSKQKSAVLKLMKKKKSFIHFTPVKWAVFSTALLSIAAATCMYYMYSSLHHIVNEQQGMADSLRKATINAAIGQLRLVEYMAGDRSIDVKSIHKLFGDAAVNVDEIIQNREITDIPEVRANLALLEETLSELINMANGRIQEAAASGEGANKGKEFDWIFNKILNAINETHDYSTRHINSEIKSQYQRQFILLLSWVLTILGISAIFHFYTSKQRRMEEHNARLAAAMDQVGEAIVITDADGVIQYVNPNFEKVTGYVREEAVGKNPRILKSGKHDADFYRAMWETLTSGKRWKGLFINKKKDGSLFHEEAIISPVLNSSGGIINYVAVKRDVTHEKMLHMARDYFTAVTSHELRDPLQKLQFLRQLFSDINKAEINQKMLGKFQASLDASYKQIEKIVLATSQLAQLINISSEEKLYEFPLYAYLMDCIRRAELEKGKREILIETDFNSLPRNTKILGNEEMFVNVTDYVLSNAIKYTPDGKRVKITAKTEGRYVIIEVRDEGIGISGEMRKLIFEPYFSLENIFHHSTGQYKHMGGGLGLGLTLARLIMDHHRGKIAIDSEGKNKGTTFTLYFIAAGQ